MRRAVILPLLVLTQLAAVEVTHPKADAVLTAYRASLAEHLSEFEQEVAAAKADHDREVARDRERAVRDLKRLISNRSEIGEQVVVYRVVLGVDREDQEARGFFGAIGTLDDELARLTEQAEPTPDPIAAVGADLLAAASAAPAAAGGDFLSPAASWPTDAKGLSYGRGPWKGLMTASGRVPVRMTIELPGGPCYLHIRYAAKSSRPMRLSIDGQVVAESCVAGVTGGWQVNQVGWDTVGPITAPPGAAIAELQRSGASPHLRGVVVSRSPEPPEVDPFADVGMTANQR